MSEDLDVMETPAHWEPLSDVENEVLNQINEWGDQHHPNGLRKSLAIVVDHSDFRGLKQVQYVELKPLLEVVTQINDITNGMGKAVWGNILLEEFLEAMLTDNEDDLYNELKQVAAVAVSWMTDIISRRNRPREYN